MEQKTTKKFVLNENNTGNNTVTITNAQTVNFTTTAYSIANIDNSWVLVEIPIDPVTKQAGDWKLTREDGSKASIVERFKINVARTLLGS